MNEPLNKKREVLEKNNTEITPFYFESDVRSAVAWLKSMLLRQLITQERLSRVIPYDITMKLIDEAFKDVLGDEK
jgi:hypothetical protein